MSHAARFAVYGFATTHEALSAEAVLEDAGVAVTVIPVPRELGAHCGLAMRVRFDDATAAEAALGAARVRWTGRMELEDRVSRP